jgi:hypothetical protein
MDSISMCSNTLYMSNMDGRTVWGGCQPQPWHNDSHLKLFSTSILDIYKVFEHMDILCITIHQKRFTVVPTPNLLWVWGSGSLVESNWCDYVKVEADSHLKLLPPSTLEKYKVFEHIYRLSISIQQQLTQFYTSYLSQILGFWVTCGVKMMSLRQGWGWRQPPQTAFPIHIRHIRSVWALWYAWRFRCPHSTGVFAVVAQASSLLLSWHRALATSQMCLILIWKTSWMGL